VLELPDVLVDGVVLVDEVVAVRCAEPVAAFAIAAPPPTSAPATASTASGLCRGNFTVATSFRSRGHSCRRPRRPVRALKRA
jgi:hypothetical protein